jgi:hypothetical protein
VGPGITSSTPVMATDGGRTVLAAGNCAAGTCLEAYRRTAQGWTATPTPMALGSDCSEQLAAISSRRVFVWSPRGLCVLNRPARGWSSVKTSTLTHLRLPVLPDRALGFTLRSATASRTRLAVIQANDYDAKDCGDQPTCPVPGQISVFHLPVGGGASPRPEVREFGVSAFSDPVLSGDSLLLIPGAPANRIDVLDTTHLVSAPRVSHLALTGLATGRPRLAFTLHVARGWPALQTVAFSAPRGLRLRSGAGVAVSVPHSVRVGHGVVSIVLNRQAVRITVGSPALGESAALRAAARRAQRAGRPPPGRRLRLTVIDRREDRFHLVAPLG